MKSAPARKPTYALADVHRLVSAGSYVVTGEAAQKAYNYFGFDHEAIVDEVLRINPAEFYKTMPANNAPGLWQDVYHHRLRLCAADGSIHIAYVKLQITTSKSWLSSNSRICEEHYGNQANYH